MGIDGKSEVARLLQAIDETYHAACLGVNGLAEGNTRHDFITAKLARVNDYHQQLAKLVGSDTAIALIYHTLADEGLPDQSTS